MRQARRSASMSITSARQQQHNLRGCCRAQHPRCTSFPGWSRAARHAPTTVYQAPDRVAAETRGTRHRPPAPFPPTQSAVAETEAAHDVLAAEDRG